ncbi:hypothetical protein AAZX31_15G228100 [Glycine max]
MVDPKQVPLDHVLFQPNKGMVDPSSNLHYDNMLFTQIDAVYSALDSLAYRKLPVHISETSSPSKGDLDETSVNLENAKNYNGNLIKISLSLPPFRHYLVVPVVHIPTVKYLQRKTDDYYLGSLYVVMDSNAATMDGTIKQLKYGAINIISQIHDSILGHILSFLPTMEAVQTSVLSTRWINIWTSITNLKLNDRVLKKMQKKQYEHLVNTMLLHLANLSIQSFSLCLTCFHYESSQVSAWISSILEMGVQRLEIQYENKIRGGRKRNHMNTVQVEASIPSPSL